MTGRLADAMPAVRAAGRSAFVAYVTGGLPGVDASLLRSLEDTGADAIEVGLPFSDPVMDGPVIQAASARAIDAGAGPEAVFGMVERARLGIPVAVMTYLNPVLAFGLERFASASIECGLTGAIVPDLPIDEAEEWIAACRRDGLATVFLAAPNSSPARLAEVAAASQGFVYCVARFGVTGARQHGGASAEAVVRALRPMTETPLLIGVGISTPDQARAACDFADGVIVGTALVEPLLAGDRAETLRRAAEIRRAIDAPP